MLKRKTRIALSTVFPSNLLRIWHLQLAILWIATAYIGGALFVATVLVGRDPPGLRRNMNVLFVALAVVIFGSLLGEWAGLVQWLPRLWFWLGTQGWEYLELGRFWQYLFIVGLSFWFFLLWCTLEPARRDPERRAIANFFLTAAAAIPVFYLPTLFFGQRHQLHDRRCMALLDHPSLGRRILRVLRHRDRCSHSLRARPR